MKAKQNDLPTALSRATNRFRAVSYLSGILAVAVIVWALIRPLHGFWPIAAVATVLLALLGVTMLAFRSVGRFAKDIARVVSLLCQDGYYRLEGDLYRTVQHSIESKQELQHQLVKLQKPSLAQILQSRVRDTYTEAEHAERYLDLEHPYLMVLVRVDFAEGYLNEVREVSKTTYFLTELIALYVKERAPDVTAFQIASDEIGFVVDAHTNMEQVLALLKEKLANESEYARFTFVVSKPRDRQTAVKTVYESLHALLRYHIPGSQSLVVFEGVETSPEEAGRFGAEWKDSLLTTLQNESVEACNNYVFDLIDRCVESGGGSAGLQRLCAEISGVVDDLLRQQCGDVPEELGTLSECLDFSQAVTPAQYKKTAGHFIANAVTFLRLRRRYEDHIIGYILDYVDEHYAEDIYLSLFAEKLQLTSAYISAYFKDKMNVNLSDYINHYRIKQAVELMETTALKNKEIAEQVGIPNVNTFIRLFKKHMGATPGEYRKQAMFSKR